MTSKGARCVALANARPLTYGTGPSMTRAHCVTRAASTPLVSAHLLASALAGLICVAACSEEGSTGVPGAAGVGGEASHAAGGNEGASEGGVSADDGVAGGGAAASGAAAGGAPGGDASAGAPLGGGAGETSGGEAGAPASAGAGGAAEALPHITSSQDVGVMTEEQFRALCDARGGTVEVMPHCGGFATAPGFSYDVTTELLSEHTCRGANTCTGWNCAIPE